NKITNLGGDLYCGKMNLDNTDKALHGAAQCISQLHTNLYDVVFLCRSKERDMIYTLRTVKWAR
ncbi:hypothetical protein HAX54_005232, partial [Datura stramonium]|nr:hypothetical protein [Datura stramonium]